MSAEPAPPPPPAGAEARAPSRRRRRWRRWFAWLLALAGTGFVLLALVGWFVWRDRTAYANRLLQHFAPSIRPVLEALEVESGRVRLYGLKLHDPETGEVFGGVEEAVMDHWIEALRRRRVGRLQVRGLRIKTSAGRLPLLLAALPRSARALETAAETGPASALPLRIEGLDVEDLRVEFTGDGTIPSISFTLDHRFEQFEWAAGTPSLKTAAFDLRDLELATPDGSKLRLPALRADIAFDPADGVLRVRQLATTGPALELTPGLLDWLKSWQTGPDAGQGGLPAWLQGVELQRLVLQALRVSAADGLPGLDRLAAEMRLDHQAENLLWQREAGFSRFGRHQLHLMGTRLRPAASEVPGHLDIPALRADISHEGASQGWVIHECAAAQPSWHWTPQWERELFPADAGNASDDKMNRATSGGPGSPLLLEVRSLLVNEGSLRLEKSDRLAFDLKTRLDLRLADLRLAAGRVESAHAQRLHLWEIETEIPGSRTAAPTLIDGVEVELRPDVLRQNGRVDSLRIRKPRLAYHLDLDALVSTNNEESAAPSQPVPLPAFFSQLHFGDLAVTEGSVRVHGRLGAPFETETTFELATESSTDGVSSMHHLSIAETRLSARESTPLPVARIGRIEARARLPELITRRRVESLTLEGGQVEFGDALLAILDPGTARTERSRRASSARREPAANKWHAGSVTVRDLGITLQRVAPGLPPFTFGVQFEAKETPLEAEGLVENIEPQKVELSSLTIPAPYGSLRPVARLDTIFVHFTLDGLLRRRISKVEILNPTLYVGEPLFWYVDYYRKFAVGDIKSGSDVPRLALASADDDAALTAAAETVSGPPRQAWIVEELQVHSGKIVLAPKGVPLPGFGQPFPFSFTTRLESGQFEAVFDIPPDNYPLPDLKLEFIGMKGQVQFNLPLKDVDNNLTETFTVDEIRWRQLSVQKGHLSVTYDMNGIYGKFGGAAYEGYIEGGFDVYLNDSYTWDGWIAATGVRATEITQKLTPAYLLLDGKFNGSVIAAGDAKELYQADLDFTGTEAGRFSIAGLNDMLDRLPPPDTAVLTDQFTRIGLETLRDFDYETVHANGRLHGREGSGFLKISGARGSRNIEVNVFDHRWKLDPPEPTP